MKYGRSVAFRLGCRGVMRGLYESSSEHSGDGNEMNGKVEINV